MAAPATHAGSPGPRANTILAVLAIALLSGATALPLVLPERATTAPPAPAPLPHYTTLAEGITALAKASGLPLTADLLAEAREQGERLDAERTRLTLDLVAATVRAAELREQALAGLSPAEKNALAAGAVASGTPLFQAAAAKVDGAALDAAARVLHDGVQRARSALDALPSCEAGEACKVDDAVEPMCPDGDGDGSWVPCDWEGSEGAHGPLPITECIDPGDGQGIIPCDACPDSANILQQACSLCVDPDGDGHVFACRRGADGFEPMSASSCTDGRLPGCDPYDNDCDANLATGQDDYYPTYEGCVCAYPSWASPPNCQCPPPSTGSWPNCQCPPPGGWDHGRCVCPPPSTGTPPNCPCPPPSTGTPPNCVCPTPPGPLGDPANHCCPTGTTGTYPNCLPNCPSGGNPPNCRCPPPSGGNPPNCSCPPPTTGTLPSCTASGACPAGTLLPRPSWVNLPPLLSYGKAVAEGYNDDVIVSLDDGGDDAYCNNAGSTFSAGPPHTLLPVARCSEFTPVAVLVEHGGNDFYHSPYYGWAETDAVSTFCFEGSSAAGIADFTDEGGNDQYNSHHVLLSPGGWYCGSGWAVPLPAADFVAHWTQGATTAGRASLADLGGDDAYNSFNDLCTPGVVTSFLVEGAQGAAGSADGVAAMVDGFGDDAYNSGNVVQPDCANGPNLALSIRNVQGAGVGGNASLDDGFGMDAYNSGNAVTAACAGPGVPALIEYTALSVACAQGCAVSGGLARHHDGQGDDNYNSGNTATVTNVGASEVLARLAATRVQGAAAGAAAQARLDDDAGDDRYQSYDTLDAWASILSITESQGFSDGGDARFTDRAGVDAFNAFDTVTGATALLASTSPDLPVPYSTRMVIDAVQGVAVGAAGTGAMDADADETPSLPMPGSDAYNAMNALNGPTVELDVTRVQGVADGGAPGGAAKGTLIDRSGDDSYDSYNTGPGGMNLRGALGAVGGWAGVGAPAAYGKGDFFDLAGTDAYAVGNWFNPPGGGCVAPGMGSLETCIDWVAGVSASPAFGAGTGALFEDVTGLATPVDLWTPWMPSYGMGMYATTLNVLGACADGGDGIDLPPGNLCTDT